MNQSTCKAIRLVSFAELWSYFFLAKETLSSAHRVILQSYWILLATLIREYKNVITLCPRQLSVVVSMAELENCLNCSEALPSCRTQDI